MTEDARERFLREITAHVPAERIAELHLFRPLRRGGTETGVAVIAVEQADVPQARAPLERTADAATPEANGEDACVSGIEADAPPGEAILADGAPGANADAPGADADAPGANADSPARRERHTVFTARYRLTRKGAERGKWEFEVVADADAPLGTVDTVVRGVQRRAGDDEEPERLTAEGVRAALDGQAWQRTT